MTVAYKYDGDWIIAEIPTKHRDDLYSVLEGARSIGCEVAGVEKPYMGKNVRTFGMLSGVFEIVCAMCSDVGLTVVEVYPSSWQRAMLSTGGYTPKKRDELKRLSIWRAVHAEKATRIESDHQADAVNIAAYLSAQR